MRLFLRALLCAALLAPAVEASAQTWPSRPIKLIVPTGPGAATDVMARLLADGVSKALGQPMVVENMPGRIRHPRASNGRPRAGRWIHPPFHQHIRSCH